MQWVRDNLGMIRTSEEIETLARSVEDNGGVYIVPAFSGLYAPYWKDNARGVIVGLTRYANKGHIARAVLEATAFQTREVVEAMEADSGIVLDQLRTDGGMVNNNLLMQFQADLLGPQGYPSRHEGDHGPRRSLRRRPRLRLLQGRLGPQSPTGPSTRPGTPKIEPAERERLYKRLDGRTGRARRGPSTWIDEHNPEALIGTSVCLRPRETREAQ